MKHPHYRLLDMLAGWTDFIAKEYGHYKKEPWAEPEFIDKVHDLYQKAGCEEDMTEEQIKIFLIEEVFPLIIGEKNDSKV